MSEHIIKQKVLDWISVRKSALEEAIQKHTGYHLRHLSGQYSSLVDLEWEIQADRFDVSESSEVQRLREALEAAQMNLMKANPQHALMDIEDALATQSEMVIE